MAISEEGFEAFCLQGLCSAALHRTLAEQLLGAEDFLSFKAMRLGGGIGGGLGVGGEVDGVRSEGRSCGSRVLK